VGPKILLTMVAVQSSHWVSRGGRGTIAKKWPYRGEVQGGSFLTLGGGKGFPLTDPSMRNGGQGRDFVEKKEKVFGRSAREGLASRHSVLVGGILAGNLFKYRKRINS